MFCSCCCCVTFWFCCLMLPVFCCCCCWCCLVWLLVSHFVVVFFSCCCLFSCICCCISLSHPVSCWCVCLFSLMFMLPLLFGVCGLRIVVATALFSYALLGWFQVPYFVWCCSYFMLSSVVLCCRLLLSHIALFWGVFVSFRCRCCLLLCLLLLL